MARETTHAIERRIAIGTTPAKAVGAFFDAADLASWWHAARSITLAAPLGPFVAQWAPADVSDDVLGRLGGTLSGTVMDYQPAASFFVANLYWHPPDGEPIGPMALALDARPDGEGVELTIRHSATGEGPRWARYFEMMDAGWERALHDLKVYLEGLEALERSAS